MFIGFLDAAHAENYTTAMRMIGVQSDRWDGSDWSDSGELSFQLSSSLISLPWLNAIGRPIGVMISFSGLMPKARRIVAWISSTLTGLAGFCFSPLGSVSPTTRPLWIPPPAMAT